MRFWFFPIYVIFLGFYKWRAAVLYKKAKAQATLYSEDKAYKITLRMAKLTKFLFKVKLIVENIEFFPENKKVLVVMNHQSNLDAVLLFTILPKKNKKPAFIAKEELLKDKRVNSFLKIIYTFPLKREDLRQSLEVITAASKHMIKRNAPLIVFPEGTRSNSAKMGEFKPGAFKPALSSTAPILPVTIINSYQAVKKWRLKKVIVKIIFSKPLKYDSFAHKRTVYLANEVKAIIQANLS